MTEESQIRQVPGMIEMCGTPQFKALLDYRREHCPYLGNTATDPTSIIRNEGAIQGWYKCLEVMRTTGIVPPQPTKETIPKGLYPDPDKPRQTTEQKRK